LHCSLNLNTASKKYMSRSKYNKADELEKKIMKLIKSRNDKNEVLEKLLKSLKEDKK